MEFGTFRKKKGGGEEITKIKMGTKKNCQYLQMKRSRLYRLRRLRFRFLSKGVENFEKS